MKMKRRRQPLDLGRPRLESDGSELDGPSDLASPDVILLTKAIDECNAYVEVVPVPPTDHSF
jgi:hypothetical protein